MVGSDIRRHRRTTRRSWAVRVRPLLMLMLRLMFPLLLIGCSEAPESGSPVTLAAARAAAQASGRLLLVGFNTAACEPCPRFDRDAEMGSSLRAALAGVVWLRLDAESGEGRRWVATYRIQRYPTYVLMNAAGRPIDRWIGCAEEKFLANLRRALSDPLTIEEREERLQYRPTAYDAGWLARNLMAIGQQRAAVHVYRAAQRMAGPEDDDYRVAIFDCLAATVDDSLRALTELRPAIAA